jgi:hypothetical protein|tara:strand:+ start:509 stop:682 length:174 start_codon:yes stop_codon:yes gene_type:complete
MTKAAYKTLNQETLTDMTVSDLVGTITQYKSKIGTEENKLIITSLKTELFSRDRSSK